LRESRTELIDGLKDDLEGSPKQHQGGNNDNGLLDNNNAAAAATRTSSISNRSVSWKEALSSNWHEFVEHWHDFFADIYRNPENSVLDVILLTVELPFTIVRKLTNPVPCDGYYCRPLVAISVALSPIWFWYYFADQF